MSKRDLSRAEKLYHAALERPPAEREGFLEKACRGDAELLREVESLLAFHSRAERFLEEPALAAATEKVAVLAGARLGPYEIVGLLGSGGMGEVYRARDPRLRREVAIKVIPEGLADRERLRRFEQEARAAGALNHPNVLAVHDIGTHEGTPYVVSELLEGQTLRQRLEGGALPVRKALDHAIQIAQGLAVAHDKGIVHRDLKPENLFVTDDGRVKILDFGLAKLTQPGALAGDHDPTDTGATTESGTVLGTAGYMSPEQVRGERADHRSDVFSFGAVLYEMLSGRRAFRRETAAETMNAILKEDPAELSRTGVQVPPGLAGVVQRCLEKRAGERFHSAHDLAFALEAISAGSTRPHGPWRSALFPGALLVAAVALVAWATGRRSATAPGPLIHAAIVETNADGIYVPFGSLAVSPDGSRVAYVADTPGMDRGKDQWERRRIHVRRFDEPEATSLSGTEGARGLFFSPDGQWIGFTEGTELKKVPVSGGAVLTVHDVKDFGMGATWTSDDTILFADGSRGALWRVGADGGAAEVLASPDRGRGEQAYRWPEILPGGRAVLFSVRSFDDTESDDGAIDALSLETGERKRLVVGGAAARYAPSGHLVYAREDTLRAVRFDADRLEVVGPSAEVLSGVAPDRRFGAPAFGVAEDGTLVYLPGVPDPGPSAVWVDRQGVASPLFDEPGAYAALRLSPEQGRVAVAVGSQAGRIAVYDRASGRLNPATQRPVSADPVWGVDLAWRPDGTQIAFQSGGGSGDLLQVAADGSGAVETLLESEYPARPASFSPDGRYLAFEQSHPETGLDIWLLPMDGSGEPTPFLVTPFHESSPAFSPDGRWIAYASYQTGESDVFVTPFPGPGPRMRVSTEGGSSPRWTRGGREIVYRNAGEVVAVPVETGDGLTVGAPRMLFEGRYRGAWDVTPDGERFLMLTLSQTLLVSHARVVFNWSPHLDGRLEGGR